MLSDSTEGCRVSPFTCAGRRANSMGSGVTPGSDFLDFAQTTPFMNGPVGIVEMVLPVQAWSVNTLFDVSAPKLLPEATPGRRTGV